MTTSPTTSAIVATLPTSAATVTTKTTLTDNEVETLLSAYKMLHGVLRTMGDDIGDDYRTNTDTLGVLLGRAHRVQKEVNAARAKKDREAFVVKVDAYIVAKCATRAKAIEAFNSLPSEVKAEMSAPSDIVTIWVEDFGSIFGAKYDIPRMTKTLHTLGYMVHVEKVDGRTKKAPQAPYVSVTIGKPFRTTDK